MNATQLILLVLFAQLLLSCGDNSGNTNNDIDNLEQWLKTPRKQRADINTQNFATKTLNQETAKVAQKQILLDAQENLSEKLKQEWKNHLIQVNDFKMALKYRIISKKPADGRSLFISMHGGGGAPKEVNDQQWQNQINLYTPNEGVYVAPRAPTDTWNMWHQGHIDALFDRIIQAAIIFEGVNPNKVYITGYSAGGDGTYQIAPRMADRWAAAAMMAGHPGDASPINLRNLPFQLWVGELDAAYNRNKLVPVWDKKLNELQKKDPKGYIHQAHVVKGKGHWMDRVDAAAIPWMEKYKRTPYPNKIAWIQDDVPQPQLYWISMPKALQKKGNTITASIKNNTINIENTNIPEAIFWLNDKMVNLDKPLKITYKDKTIYNEIVPRTIATIYQNINDRYDPAKLFTARIKVKIQ